MNRKQDPNSKHAETLLRALQSDKQIVRACMEAKLSEIDAEIARLKKTGAAPAKAPAPAAKPATKTKGVAKKSNSRIGEAGKARIAAAQKKRWAKARKERRAAGVNNPTAAAAD